eukprot:TRINITY_DN1932_c0_g1::TRINITY_DN1932_c0_g1_i1::g.23049::m.23049 TRINITY_DN1932_c0_g1::TRINITY_DN1932_c0_g1_i1::g.23049  ORF type:complete len:2717 (+),score=940.13,sp/F4I893/ILA_ARATH/35.18/0.0,HEAT/PF02985.17/1.4e+03,HEAT/PF02985.17/1.4e+03,HEAT/PF02985.17/1.9e+03,HEAT/PF02985.17/67,HEAT/PF02985.17/6.2e+03,HEAT/PF02985.17/34,HEAT/PF02985.17/3.3e+03,HEAT/PF02985.17/0.11,HEAT/PF02985.17/0.013,HEAT/PF02985.17/0.069,HEAT/PF02985.17/1.4e+03,HEAT/PF02985.17/0.012,HEAT/PF02985.17/8e+03,HEAT/PF02985.17
MSGDEIEIETSEYDLSSALQHLNAPSKTLRMASMKFLKDGAVAETFDSESVYVIFSALFRIIPVIHDRASIREADDVIQLLGGVLTGADAAKLASTLTTLSKRVHATRHTEKRDFAFLVYLRWSLTFTAVTRKALQETACLNDMIHAQARVLHSILRTGNERAQRLAFTLVKSSLQTQPETIGVYTEVLLSPECTYPMEAASFIPNLLRAWNNKVPNDVRSNVLKLYVTSAWQQQSRPAPVVHTSWKPFLKSLTAEEFTQTVLPVVDKTCKRNPDLALASLQALLGSLDLDLSPHASQLLALLDPFLTSKEDRPREEAVQCVSALAARCGDMAVLRTCCDNIIKSLKGKLPPVRAALLSAVDALAAAPKSDSAAIRAEVEAIVDGLGKVVQEESHDEARGAGLVAMGRWLGRDGCMTPAAAKVYVSKHALKTDKDSVRAAALDSLSLVVGRGGVEACKQAGAEVVPALLEVIKTTATKPAVRHHALDAMRIVSVCAASDPAADAAADKAKLWGVLTSGTFLSEEGLASLPPRGAVSLLGLLESLIASHSAKLNTFPAQAQSAVYETVCRGLTHHTQASVRLAARDVVKRLYATNTNAAGALLAAFRGYLAKESQHEAYGRHAHAHAKGAAKDEGKKDDTAATAAAAAKDAAAPKEEEDAEKATWKRRGFRLAAFMDLVPVPCPDSLLPTVLLLSHHPLIAHPKHFTVCWEGVSRRVSSPLHTHAETLIQAALGVDGVLSPDHNERVGGSRACGSVFRAFTSQVWGHVQQYLTAALDATPLRSITPFDLKVFHAAEGTLVKPDEQEGIYVPQVIDSRNQKFSKFQLKLYGKDELEEMERERKEKEKQAAQPAKATETKKAVIKPSAAKPAAKGKEEGKRGGKDEGKKAGQKTAQEMQAEMDAQELARQSALRAHMRTLKIAITAALHVLRFSAELNREAFHEHIPFALDVLKPCMPSPLVARTAYAALLAVVSAVSPAPLSALAPHITYALARVYHYNDTNRYSVASLGDVTSSALQAIRPRVRFALTPQSLHVILPIMECGMRHGSTMEAQDAALHILNVHVHPSLAATPYPRHLIIPIVIYMLDTLARIRDATKDVLFKLASPLTAEELDPLLEGLLSGEGSVRRATLEALGNTKSFRAPPCPVHPLVSCRLWLARYDSDAASAARANDLWKIYGHELGQEHVKDLLTYVSHPQEVIRSMCASSVAGALEQYPAAVQDILSKLFAMFVDASYTPEDDEETVDVTVLQQYRDTRLGIAAGMKAVSRVITTRDLPVTFTFFVSKALGDQDDDVAQLMADAALQIIDDHGEANAPVLLPIFESYFERTAAEGGSQDRTRQAVVLCLGGLAKHLKDTKKILDITDKLLEVLRTPSELVQRTVAKCLPGLMTVVKPHAQDLVPQMLKRLFDGQTMADRRGAAFGLAGMVKGLGLASLKQFEVIAALNSACDRKGPDSHKARQGAMFAFECLCDFLGRLFEPYVIQVLPLLLSCFGDPSDEVRRATEGAARAMMGQLSGQGVKLVLPALLKGLEDRAWRTKEASVDLLGAMAYCAPKQLSQCLPQIVPRLTEVLADSHAKVREAADTALHEIGAVIKNPEIQALVPTLLEALSKPNEFTREALDQLLITQFVHSVDAPSLALIVPVLYRGLRERGTEVKKRAAQIVGNMCSLIGDPKDVLPYLPTLLPEVKAVLLDPIPEVRAIAGKALGALLKGLGEENFTTLVPWLLETVTADTSSVERSGAALGLAEVLAALGMDRVEQLLPTFIKGTSNSKAYIREGSLLMFNYLPRSLGDKFQPFLDQVLPPILHGLADESESVREVALGASRTLVNYYATTSLDILMPTLHSGLASANWRIRHSAVQLMGDLLYNIAGASGRIQVDISAEGDGISTAEQENAILKALGAEQRDSILATLYLARSDVSVLVRQAAIHVWKQIVSNTPKTLKDILPKIMTTILECVSSSEPERQEMASRALGELVKKMGEKVVPEVIPFLQQGLRSPDDVTRQGVCLALSEVMGSAGRQQVIHFADQFIPTLRHALCDSSAQVRSAAAETFGILHRIIGTRAIDDVVPPLLAQLKDPALSQNALHGLSNLMSSRSTVLLPYLIPKLTAIPMSIAHAQALAVLAQVAPLIHHYLHCIVPGLIDGLQRPDVDVRAGVRDAAGNILSVITEEGLNSVLVELMKGMNEVGSAMAGVRRSTCELVLLFAEGTKIDLTNHIEILLQPLFRLQNDLSPDVVEAAWKATEAVCKHVKKDDMVMHISFLRDAIEGVVSDDRSKNKSFVLPGFCLPKGLGPILPMFLHALTVGTPDIRESAALGIGELISLTSEEGLRPFVVQTTGPLIRVIGDRFPWQIKASILKTLILLIDKGGAMLKPFLPQLQTTFIKCINDPTSLVRKRAGTALSHLMKLQTKVDPVVTDMHNSVKTGGAGGAGGASPQVREAMLAALKGVLLQSGSLVSLPVLSALPDTLFALLADQDELVRIAAAKALGVTIKYLPADLARANIDRVVGGGGEDTWEGVQGKVYSVAYMVRYMPDALPAVAEHALTNIKTAIKHDKAAVRQAGVMCIACVLTYCRASGKVEKMLASALGTLIADKTSPLPIREAAIRAVSRFAKIRPDGVQGYLTVLIPPLVEAAKEKNYGIKQEAEKAIIRALSMRDGDYMLRYYIQEADEAAGNAVNELYRKVLAPIASGESDEEDSYNSDADV